MHAAKFMAGTVVACVALGPAALATAFQAAQTAPASTPDARNEAIRDHADEAEDMVEALLDWRHVLTTTTARGTDVSTPVAPTNTLISVNAADVQRLRAALEALAQMTPAAAGASTATSPRGDLRAHAEKAIEIARELGASSSSAVGTSGTDRPVMVMVDRTALQRLEIELDAIDRLIPRTFK